MKINSFHLESCKTRAKHEHLAKLLYLFLKTILSKIDEKLVKKKAIPYHMFARIDPSKLVMWTLVAHD